MVLSSLRHGAAAPRGAAAVAVCVGIVVCWGAGPLRGQTAERPASGGFVESATGGGVRPRPSTAEMQAMLPTRGAFTFPAPYSTAAIRVTTAADCGGADCVVPVGYSYWSNINNHRGADVMLVFAGLEKQRGGGGPTLFSVDKRTGETRNLGPLFAANDPLSWSNGEGWYFSAGHPYTLYLHDGPRMRRFDVAQRTLSTVFDVSGQFGTDKYVWQLHSSNDDRVHSATLRQHGSGEMLGCLVYDEGAARALWFPKRGDFDECQIDRSGRWLVIKEDVDRANGEDNRIIDLLTGAEQLLLDPDGAAGHSDVGFGSMLAEDNYHQLPGAVRRWNFGLDMRGGQPASPPGQGEVVYALSSWRTGVGHVAFGGARADLPIEQQRACASNASRETLSHVNEIVCFPLDGSLSTIVVAPNLVDLNAAGGGSDDYSKMPKGNLDVTGEYFVWTANAGTSRLDMFIVRIPSIGPGLPPAPPLGPPDPPSGPPADPPLPPAASSITWTSLVNAAVSGVDLRKTAGCGGCADAGAVSVERIASGDGGVFFTAADAQALRFVGLANGSAPTSPQSWPFALRIGQGIVEVRESGAYRADAPLAPGDVLGIGVQGGRVLYSKNGATFYTGAAAPNYPLLVNAALLDAAASVTGAALIGAATGGGGTSTGGGTASAVTWTNVLNVQASAGSLLKSGGCDGCPDAGAASVERLTAGNGGVTFAVADAGPLQMLGLSVVDGSTDPSEIRFGLRLQGGRAEVRESGAYRSETPVAGGDRLSIVVRSGVVEYARNGTVFYSSGTPPVYPLLVDASLLGWGAAVSSVSWVAH